MGCGLEVFALPDHVRSTRPAGANLCTLFVSSLRDPSVADHDDGERHALIAGHSSSVRMGLLSLESDPFDGSARPFIAFHGAGGEMTPRQRCGSAPGHSGRR